MFLIHLQEIDPVALQLGPIAIRWYSLAYITGIIVAMFFLKKQNDQHKIMSQQAYDDWLMWIVFSIIIGGRLGYVLFYNGEYFLANPLEILMVWHGGMSFHGGLFGVIFGMYLFCRKFKITYFRLMDVLAIIAPIGLFFGRIANFINLELYGRATNSDYGVIFPGAGDFPRHPSQLYEAVLEGLVLFIILFSLSRFTKIQQRSGAISGLFLALYGIFRIIIENFREPDLQLGFLFQNITMGQVLSLPLILAGVVIFLKSKKSIF